MRLLLTLVILAALGSSRAVADVPTNVRSFLSQNCTDCHEGDAAEAGLDLAALAGDLEGLDESATFERWVRVLDRVAAGEMPPADVSIIKPQEADRFGTELGGWLRESAEQRRGWQGQTEGMALPPRL